VREIRMLRAMWRELETGLRRLLHGHEGGNPGHSQGAVYGLPRQFPTLPRRTISGSFPTANAEYVVNVIRPRRSLLRLPRLRMVILQVLERAFGDRGKLSSFCGDFYLARTTGEQTDS
jgi:hypothetical protein